MSAASLRAERQASAPSGATEKRERHARDYLPNHECIVYKRGAVLTYMRDIGVASVYPRGWPTYLSSVVSSPPRVAPYLIRDERTRTDIGAGISVTATTYGMPRVAIESLFAPQLRAIALRGFGVWCNYGAGAFFDLTGSIPRMRRLSPRVNSYANVYLLFYQRHATARAQRCRHRRRRRIHVLVHWNTCARTCSRIRICGAIVQTHPGAAIMCAGVTIVTEMGEFNSFNEFGRPNKHLRDI